MKPQSPNHMTDTRIQQSQESKDQEPFIDIVSLANNARDTGCIVINDYSDITGSSPEGVIFDGRNGQEFEDDGIIAHLEAAIQRIRLYHKPVCQHLCPEWDGLDINEFDPEFSACTCDWSSKCVGN